MVVNTDGEETGPGSTLTDGVKLTAQSCEVVQETGNEKSLHRYVDGGVGFQDQKPAKGTGISLIPFPKVPSQSSVLNTEHNKAQRENADEGDSFLSNTTLTLQSDAYIEDGKTELSRGAHVSFETDTFADDTCVQLEECSSPLHPAEIMEILETNTNDDCDAMYNTLFDELSSSDASAFKLELPINHDMDQMGGEGYTLLYKAALEGHLEDIDDLISVGASPNKPSKGGRSPLHAAAQEGHAHIVDFLILQGADVNVECDLGQTPLHTAASSGYTGIVDSLIAEGANVNKKDDAGWTPFHSAVHYGHLKSVKYLMTQGANQNRYAGMIPLYAAAHFGYLDIIELFISKGADVKEEDDKGMIALHGAAARGHLEVMKYLIQQGSDVNKGDAKGWTPFNAAVQYGHLEAVQYLMTEGAKQNRYAGMSPLYSAAVSGHGDLVKFFISKGVDVNEENDSGRIPLHGAAIHGKTEVMEYLIQQGSSVNKSDTKGWTPFNAAVEYGHLEAVKYLMTEGAKWNRYDDMTPLYASAQFGHLDIVKFFISNGADVNEEHDNGMIPLNGAASGGHLEVMEYLIQQGSDINKADADGWTPFIAAVQYGHLQAVKSLMTKGAKQNRCDEMTPLYAAAQDGHLDIVKFFISKGGDVNEENDNGMIPLHGAAAGGHLEVMEYLIQQGSDINKAGSDGWTPFNAAVQYGHLEAVKSLMTKGAKQNKYAGMNPLYAAAQDSHLDIVKFFISKGADVNEEDDEGMIPLHGAAAGGHLKVMEYLIHQGSDVNKADGDGWTPFNAAVRNGFLEVVKVLLAQGAQTTRYEGLTPLYIATQYNHRDVVNLLVSSGYDVNERNECGKSPLHAACYNGNMDIVKVLIHHNATVNEQDHDRWTPLHAASQEGHRDVVDYLALHGADMNMKDVDGLTPLKAAANTAHEHTIEDISSCRGDPNEKETRDPQSRGEPNLIKRVFVMVSLKDADRRSRKGQLASQVDNVDDMNDCTQADNAKREDGELSLKNILIRVENDEESGREKLNPFIHAKLKYPGNGEQDPMIHRSGAMESAVTTIGADGSSPRGSQTWQYSGFDPPFQTMETEGHPSEEPGSRCYSIIDENSEMRDFPSQMNAGNDLPISEPSEIESFPKHPPYVAQQKWYDGDPVPIQGTSSNPGWKIGTKRRTSVDRCPSILTLVQTLLQTIIALAIILAGSPILVAGSDITERVTLQAGKPGVVPFLLPISPSNTSQIVLYYILRFESQPRPFCINGEADIEGFKSPSQLPRFTTSVIETVSSYCINLLIDIVDTLDEDRYVLTAVRRGYENVWHETIKKEIVVDFPPRPAICFITFSENDGYSYEVHCRATAGSVKATLSCYQNDQKIDIRGDIRDNGQVIRGIFWLSDNTYFSCCSHDIHLNVSETMCNDFEWPPNKETTSLTVNTVSTVTTPTLQIESLTGSGACRQFMLPSLWHFTYLFIYFLTFATIY